MEYIKNHVELASFRLVEQDKERYNIIKLLSIFVGKLQEIEDVLFYTFDRMGVFTASGKTLDMIGQIVGEERNYRDDQGYRVGIIGKIAINNGCGTADEIIGIISLFFESAIIKVTDLYPCGFAVSIATSFDLEKLRAIRALLSVIKPAGVGGYMLSTYSYDENVFRFREGQYIEYNYKVHSIDDIILQTGSDLDGLLAVNSFKGIEKSPAQTSYGEQYQVEYSFVVDEVNSYVVDNDLNALNLVKTYHESQDFFIVGGGMLAEAING
jgi:hypothetical protein